MDEGTDEGRHTRLPVAIVAKGIYPRGRRESSWISINVPSVAITIHSSIAHKLVAVH